MIGLVVLFPFFFNLFVFTFLFCLKLFSVCLFVLLFSGGGLHYVRVLQSPTMSRRIK